MEHVFLHGRQIVVNTIRDLFDREIRETAYNLRGFRLYPLEDLIKVSGSTIKDVSVLIKSDIPTETVSGVVIDVTADELKIIDNHFRSPSSYCRDTITTDEYLSLHIYKYQFLH